MELSEETYLQNQNEASRVNPSDEHFWFNRPAIILYLIQFILFQNSFEIAFFFWIWVSQSCSSLLTFFFNVLSCYLLAIKYLDHLRIRLLYHGEYWLPHSKTCYRVIMLHSWAFFFLFVATKAIARNLCILQTICIFLFVQCYHSSPVQL